MRSTICSLLVVFSLGALAAEEGKHLFILSGQSNMAGLRADESFTPAVEKQFGKDGVIVVKSAKGGQPIRRWDQTWQATEGQDTEQIGDLYAVLMESVKVATREQQIATVTFLWMQGERDAKEGLADKYGQAFQNILAQLKRDLKLEQINFVIGRLSDYGVNKRPSPQWIKVREVQVALAAESAQGEWVDTDDLNDGKNRKGKEIKDDLHYSADGYVVFGERLAEKAISLLAAK